MAVRIDGRNAPARFAWSLQRNDIVTLPDIKVWIDRWIRLQNRTACPDIAAELARPITRQRLVLAVLIDQRRTISRAGRSGSSRPSVQATILTRSANMPSTLE
ncbi:hypothetical protein SIAM614_13058 [Stappia aggregata IAM 12614]|uniref:Uncharacterized protein n=1 Tax=Roseibium aggregatum (strain ATCC 25650 / DSM 13394 / JCM 20685 / NBRC 16684 / NCIMB 2208 / IAM 12614 / B1) TaxID=384765 RepID=A0NQ87_ROSAI|nr:hypothetical protein [Roseibium aggregatum]EAV44945.1 hypothetical protein SIAM614_13058 [Stappia aggregata IAM 12614] [Roseibium aggregatum IAM 12614]